MIPSYRAGINLAHAVGQAELAAKLRDPEHHAAACAERDALASENAKSVQLGHGSIFERCHVSKTVHETLTHVLEGCGKP